MVSSSYEPDEIIEAAGPRVSVIVPAYNEGRTIYATLLEICAALTHLALEVIVVDDGSRDNTFTECQRAAALGRPITPVRMPTNSGKGAALFHGAALASGDFIVFLDADLEIAPGYVALLVQKLQAGMADAVVGTKQYSNTRFPLTRRLLSRIYCWLVAFLFGLSLSDTQTGIKAFRREVLKATIPRCRVRRFAFDIELLVATVRSGYTVSEYKVEVEYRRAGLPPRLGLRSMVGMLWDTSAIYYRASFWRWLEPGLGTRVWMVLFVIGVLVLGMGIARFLTPLVLKPPLSTVVYFLALQFLPKLLRDWLLVVGGLGLLIISLVQLNKSLLSAFARRDRGDLDGILRRK